MRKELKKIDQQSLRFCARIERFGTKTFKDHIDETILLKNVCRVDTKQQVTDHLWFTVGKTIGELNLQPGDVIEFDARVTGYEKGHSQSRTSDYKLSRPSKIVKVQNLANTQSPLLRFLHSHGTG